MLLPTVKCHAHIRHHCMELQAKYPQASGPYGCLHMGTPGGTSKILMPGSLPEMEISLVWDVAWALEFFKDPQVMLMCRQVGKRNRFALQT